MSSKMAIPDRTAIYQPPSTELAGVEDIMIPGATVPEECTQLLLLTPGIVDDDFPRILKSDDMDLVHETFLHAVKSQWKLRWHRADEHGEGSLSEGDRGEPPVQERRGSVIKAMNTQANTDNEPHSEPNGDDKSNRWSPEDLWVIIASKIVVENPRLTTLDNDGQLSYFGNDQYNILCLAARYESPILVGRLLESMKQNCTGVAFQDMICFSGPRHSKSPLELAIDNLDVDSVEILLWHVPKLILVRNEETDENCLHMLIRATRALEDKGRVNRAQVILQHIAKIDISLADPCSLFEDVCKQFVDASGRIMAGGTPFQLAEKMVDEENGAEEFSNFLENLNKFLFTTGIRTENGDMMVHKALSGGHGTQKRLFSLDLGHQDMSKFSNWLKASEKTFEQGTEVALNQWLLFVRLPRLRRGSVNEHKRPEGSDVDKLLARLFSLLETRGVKKVWRLVVEDDFENPTSDILIVTFLKRLHVEILDWKKPDLDIDQILLTEELRESIQDIHLYSGNVPSLLYWCGDEGLFRFPRLRQAHIVGLKKVFYYLPMVAIRTHQRIETPWVGLVNANFAQDQYHTKTLIEGLKRAELRFNLAERTMNRRIRLLISQLDLWRLSKLNVLRMQHNSTGSRFFEALRECQEALIRIQDTRSSPDDLAIKVAIVDNGVDPWQPDIAAQVKGGFCAVEGSWSTPEHAHGTMMASLVKRVNPLVHIYAYRVASYSHDIPIERAAEAIMHAADAGMDIINCSWITTQNNLKLQHAIEYASSHSKTKEPALIFGATSEEPYFYKSVWPADYASHVISVSAASESGRNRVETRTRFDLLLLGENMPAAGLSENGDMDEAVSGSSVSTAIASGLASLILVYCKLLEEEPGQWREFKRKDKIVEVFKSMSHITGNGERYVNPSLIFQDRFEFGMPSQQAQEIFRDSFYRSGYYPWR